MTSTVPARPALTESIRPVSPNSTVEGSDNKLSQPVDTWPTVDRVEEFSRLSAAVRARRGAVILGAAGVGKTTLACMGAELALGRGMRIYPRGTPGCAHCQLDAIGTAQRDICDWLDDKMGRGSA
jgi:polynucleotide 5'-kinase involved in rRNA processing